MYTAVDEWPTALLSGCNMEFVLGGMLYLTYGGGRAHTVNT